MRNWCNKLCLIKYNVFYGLCALGNYVLPSDNMQLDDVVNVKPGQFTQNNIRFYQNLTWSHYKMSLNVFYHTILDCSMPFGNIIDEKIKSLCYSLCYHNYDKTTSASWLWRRYHDIRHNQYNLSALLYTHMFWYTVP